MTREVAGTAVTHVKTRTRSVIEFESHVPTEADFRRSSRSPGAGDLDPPEVAARLLHDAARYAGNSCIGRERVWLSRSEVTKWLSEGVLLLVSPLDTENMTEIELSEEQEVLLGWLDKHQVQHIRVVE